VNVYKLPSLHWGQNTPTTFDHPVLYVGNFNSHHSMWGYADTSADADTLVEWATHNNLTLINDARQAPWNVSLS